MDGDWKFYYANGNIIEWFLFKWQWKEKNNITKIPINGRTGNWTGWHENGIKWSGYHLKMVKSMEFRKLV